MHAEFCALLANFLDLLDLITLLEVALLDILDSVLILLLERVQLVHAHVHDVLLSAWVGDHHTEVRGEL
jgi:hypothetical protein